MFVPFRGVAAEPGTAAAAAATATPTPVATATPTPAAADSQQMTVRARRIPAAAGRTGASETVDLEQFAARAVRLAEILDGAAGVDVQDYGAGLGARISIRGASPDEVLVIADGVRMNPAAGGGADLEAIPRELVDRVEIARGAGAARFGAGALGGVLVFESDPAARRGGATVSAGSFGTVTATASAVARQGGWTLDAGAREQHVGDSFRYHDSIADADRTRTNAGAQSLGASLGAKGNALGGVLALRAFGTTRAGGAPGLSEFPTTEATHGEDEGALVAQWTSGEADRSRATIWEIEGSQRFSAARFRDPKPLLGVTTVATDTRESRSEISTSAQRAIGGTLSLAGGADLRDERMAGGAFGGHAREVGGARAALAWTPADLEAELAARVEAAYDDPARPSSSAPAGATSRALAVEALPSAGVAWHPGVAWTLRAHAGRSWRLPSFQERWLPDQETVGGNPSLRPERAWSGDAGVSFCAGDGARVGVSLEGTAFATRLQDAIVFAPVSAYRWEAVNSGPAWMAGGELTASLATPWVEVTGSATRTETQRDQTGAPLPGRPRDKAALRATARLFGDALEPFADARWQARSYADFYGNLTVPSGTRVGAGLTARLHEGRAGDLALTLEGTNLGDADVRDARFYPKPGRAFWLTLAWRAHEAP